MPSEEITVGFQVRIMRTIIGICRTRCLISMASWQQESRICGKTIDMFDFSLNLG